MWDSVISRQHWTLAFFTFPSKAESEVDLSPRWCKHKVFGWGGGRLCKCRSNCVSLGLQLRCCCGSNAGVEELVLKVLRLVLQGCSKVWWFGTSECMKLINGGGIVPSLMGVCVSLAVIRCVRDTTRELTAKAACVVVFCCCPSTVDALGFGCMGGWPAWWDCAVWHQGRFLGWHGLIC